VPQIHFPVSDEDSLAVARSLLGDRYAIDREIGRGGMATVYLAEETKHGRQVAIKVLRPELAATLGADRFLREIGIAARLSHPHLVPLIDSGDAGGLLYYVSAYLAGGSLRDRLQREGKLPLRDALRIAEEVSTALDYAHRAGFVHRDVKPENILFADGHALLADFGVARVCCGDGETPVTAAGLAVGTPEYMSPEQASGDRDVDARSDVYALACVVYEMLTGAPPFRSDSQRQVMVRHVTETPVRVRAVQPEVPAPVDDAIARALAKDPSTRFGSACDFVAAMQVEAAPRGRVFTGAKRNIAVLPFVNASPDPDNEYLSDGITDELIDALAKVEGLRLASRTSVFALKGKPQDVRAIGALLDCTVVLEGTVRRAGQQLRITAQLTSTDDGHLRWSQRYDRPMDDAFAIQDEIARTIVNTLRATSFADIAAPPLRRHTENAAAYSLYLKGRFEWNRRTQEGVAAGIKFFEQAIAADPNYALAYTGLADCYSLHVDYRSVPVVEGFELGVGAGEIVGLTGQVGSGTSEVLRGLAGLEPEAHGSVEVDGVRLPLGSPVRALRAGVGFASNDRKSEGLFLSQTSRLNLIATRLKALSRAGLFRRRAARRQADELARFVGLDERRVSSPVVALSGGNQQKVFLGRCLDRGDIKLLLLDEPTRGVDVAGRADIHDLLRTASQAGVAVIFASTEVDEILDLSHVVVTMFGGRVVATRSRAEVTTEKLSADMTMSRERVATAAADEEGLRA